jgi:hypothetical protein
MFLRFDSQIFASGDSMRKFGEASLDLANSLQTHVSDASPEAQGEGKENGTRGGGINFRKYVFYAMVAESEIRAGIVFIGFSFLVFTVY